MLLIITYLTQTSFSNNMMSQRQLYFMDISLRLLFSEEIIIPLKVFLNQLQNYMTYNYYE